MEHILVVPNGTTQIITINRPEKENKLNLACMAELILALKTAEAEAECRTIILTATGSYFCNGGELGDFRTQSSLQIREFGTKFIELHTTITNLTKPVIAAVQGHALGGGFSLVEACDLAVAVHEVTFGTPEIKAGIAPMMALTGVARLVNRKKAMELAWLGEPLTAQAAQKLGLINWLVDAEKLMETALGICQRLAEYNPTALALSKALYQDLDSLTYECQLKTGLQMLVSLLKSADASEALTAQAEARNPKWQGR